MRDGRDVGGGIRAIEITGKFAKQKSGKMARGHHGGSRGRGPSRPRPWQKRALGMCLGLGLLGTGWAQ